MFIITLRRHARYFFSRRPQWAFDYAIMMYGTCFMLCGAYTLAQNNHVRERYVLSPAVRYAMQATLDLVLWFIFFFPGIIALVVAGYYFAEMSWRFRERSPMIAGRPTDLSFQDGHSHRRFLYWPAGHCGSPALSCRHPYWRLA